MDTHSANIAKLQHDPALRLMFEARKRVFVDLLKWDVPVLDDKYEVDQFDTPDAHYLVLTGACAKHRASTRLLPTERPHILGNLFPYLCEGAVPCGRNIKEITRFCIEPTLCRGERRSARNQLVTALVKHATHAGITEYSAVASMAWYRQISDFGWECRTLGPMREVCGEKLVALHLFIDDRTQAALEIAGIYNPTGFQLATAGRLQ